MNIIQQTIDYIFFLSIGEETARDYFNEVKNFREVDDTKTTITFSDLEIWHITSGPTAFHTLITTQLKSAGYQSTGKKNFSCFFLLYELTFASLQFTIFF